MSGKPLSDLVRQGWTVVAYSATDMSGETYRHNVLLTLRKKMIGEGLVVSEFDI